ncbi:MAG: hypothetical protein JWR77_1068, partial [Rhizorhabdus sp.]|nr:hypothetical protein [Rhizorhabdus sp.]
IYDFESTHLGDPVHDLAALRLRHGSEPLGAEPAHLIRHYAKVTGVPVDPHALSFHTASFMLASVMSMAGPLSCMADEALQVEYLIWDLTCTRALMWAIAELLGETITPAAPLPGRSRGRSAVVGRALRGTIARMQAGADSRQAMDATSAAHLAEWIEAASAPAAAHEAADLDRAVAILGTRPDDWRAADTAMERFVADAGPEQDLALFRYFAAQVEDRVSEAVPFQDRMAQYALDPVALQV